MGNNKTTHRGMTPAQQSTYDKIMADVGVELREFILASKKGKLTIHYSGGADARLEKTVSRPIKTP